MKYVYGPVPPRRLGQSLGIDPIPLKTCNWNCVYCQLGRTRPVVSQALAELEASGQAQVVERRPVSLFARCLTPRLGLAHASTSNVKQ